MWYERVQFNTFIGCDAEPFKSFFWFKEIIFFFFYCKVSQVDCYAKITRLANIAEWDLITLQYCFIVSICRVFRPYSSNWFLGHVGYLLRTVAIHSFIWKNTLKWPPWKTEVLWNSFDVSLWNKIFILMTVFSKNQNKEFVKNDNDHTVCLLCLTGDARSVVRQPIGSVYFGQFTK